MTSREEMISRANAEALALLAAIEQMNIEPAADYIRAHPPSPEAIASLAFLYAHLAVKARARLAASKPRKDRNLVDRVRATGCTSFEDLWEHEREAREAWQRAHPDRKGSGIITQDHDAKSIKNALRKART